MGGWKGGVRGAVSGGARGNGASSSIHRFFVVRENSIVSMCTGFALVHIPGYFL